jgi:hypothetical protein
MINAQNSILIIIDDREFTSNEIARVVGNRHYGEITFKRQQLSSYIISILPEWAKDHFIEVKHNDDLKETKDKIISCERYKSVCVISTRGGFVDLHALNQIIERLPYAEENFADRQYNPLFIFFKNAVDLLNIWERFSISSLPDWNASLDVQVLKSVDVLDLANVRDFLNFTSGSTATRHFNEIKGDAYFYTKSSTDKNKMLAEYSFYQLVPEKMRPWLIQTFDFNQAGDTASYSMMRYYLADAALQWVHGAFSVQSFSEFIQRLLFFIHTRPQRSCSVSSSGDAAKKLFVDKVTERIEKLLSMPVGVSINNLVKSANPDLDITILQQRYLRLYQRYSKQFECGYEVVGHGDPCFSNVLYDQERYLMKLIDPKGATSEEDIWTHPFYDLCKVSHSVMGDYDFINNGLYSVNFTNDNDIKLNVNFSNHQTLKREFIRQLESLGYDANIIRLGEASLFLSMLPLHTDYPNKVMGFMLVAKNILDEIEVVKDGSH